MNRPDDPRDDEKDARRDADRFSAGAGVSPVRAAHAARAAFLAPPPLPGLQPLKERLLIPDLWLRLGLPFPARGGLGERKAHTLRGSRKDWPCGAAVLRRYPAFRTLLVVEGGPDYLAALHFALGCGAWDALPVAMLGRSTGGLIAPEALALMAGRRVRLYPHADADGGGLLAARRWASQLHAAGCPCDFFDFRPLQQAGGHAVKDLNDAVLALSHSDNPCSQTSQNIIP